MKTMIRMFIVAAVCFAAVATFAGQTQQVAPGEVPEGITAEDWGIVQEAYLKASNTGSNDKFGVSGAISGNTIVLGAQGESSNATRVNGTQADNSAPRAGAVYVFVKNGTTWSQQAYLKPSNTDADDNFGCSVAISGDTVLVGARNEASNATGINGNQADNSYGGAGAAYVFVRNGSTWAQQAYLKASDTELGDAFGSTVVLSEDTIVIGNGYGHQAYVFERNGTTWSQQAILKASNHNPGDLFGSALAISGDTIVVGAPSEASNATGVNGNQNDNSVIDAGAAYVFTRSGTTWSQQAYLKASNTGFGDWFGEAVTISGDTIVVGAYKERSNATGVNGDQSDNSAESSGAAYVFVRNGTTWSQQAYLKASNTGAWDYFGGSVSISGDTVMVGAVWEDSNAAGVNGNQNDNSVIDAGAAYVFTRSGTTWNQQAYLKASNTDSDDRFGNTVVISSDTILVGALFEDSNAAGVNGNQADNSAGNAGAVYVFTGFGPESNQATITACYPVATGFTLEWIPVAGRDSVVKYSPDLATPFTDLSATLPYPVNTYTDTLHGDDGKCFYRVDLVP